MPQNVADPNRPYDDRAYITVEGLQISVELHRFVEETLSPTVGVAPPTIWDGLARLHRDFGDENDALIAERERLQDEIDAEIDRLRAEAVDPPTPDEAALEHIGYLTGEGDDFIIETDQVDVEISAIPGPQLVVPATNARYVLNAANARWGSLYDALYGTDAIGSSPPESPGYDSARGAEVIAWVRRFLNEAVPLDGADHADVAEYRIVSGQLQATVGDVAHGLGDPNQLVGYVGEPESPGQVLLQNHGLGITLLLDRSSDVGATDLAGVSDVHLEAALTAIVDLEDSVATVNAADKVSAYQNWFGLMAGTLTADVAKGGKTFTRSLNEDVMQRTPDGLARTARARALLLCRNAADLIKTPAVLDSSGRELSEGLLDALLTVACALADPAVGAKSSVATPLRAESQTANSRFGSVYIVKPKMHGPDEVAYVVRVFDAVENILGLPANTVKLGIMDEERRTTLNLKECVRAAKERVCFINTGFLDRTGDEIHTSMRAGPMVPKSEMKSQPWIRAYEDNNVDVGLLCGFEGRAQIGKGMWAAPDKMHDMLSQKQAHPSSGASCAWVPSPTAAVLHATHYHQVDVRAVQREIAQLLETFGRRAELEDLLTVPLTKLELLSPEVIRRELDNNAQGILGYVVRWVDAGVGCSKVPDINDVGLMEDRATCRISSQHMANWLLHGVADEAQIIETMRRMAEIVDRQNSDNPLYRPMSPSFDGQAFLAACALVLRGADQPSGYTEPLLYEHRQALLAS